MAHADVQGGARRGRDERSPPPGKRRDGEKEAGESDGRENVIRPSLCPSPLLPRSPDRLPAMLACEGTGWPSCVHAGTAMGRGGAGGNQGLTMRS